jgi:hypothetical protein
MKFRTVLFLLSAAATHAGPRTSSNYTIATDIADSGGKRATSATTYTNDGSIGGVAGFSTVAAPAETVKHGYDKGTDHLSKFQRDILSGPG